MTAKLLDRETPLRDLHTALNEAAAGEGRITIITGEAGIGKTSLVEQFARQQQASRVLWGTCDSLFTPRPLGPLHDISLQSKGELLALLNSDADRQAIFSACFVELHDRPTIMVFEDIHWADEASLDLIKYLGRRIQRTASLLILTYRDDEIGAGHPLQLVLGDLRPPATTRLHLSPLSKPSVFALASAAGQTEQADELFDTTSGNPFFVTEILASKGAGLPSTVRDAVLARAARLSPPARAVLDAAAVIGLRVEPWLLSNISGADPASVEECIAGGMLQFQGDDYAFRHELARQTILGTISPERKLVLHRMTLTGLKGFPETSRDLVRLANHAEGTKDASAVLEYAPAAARQASAASSHREAIAFYESALRFAERLPPAEHARMLDAYALELFFASRLADSSTILEKSIALWHSIGDTPREGDNFAWLAQGYHIFGRKAEAEQASRSAIAILEALPPTAELARAYKAQCFIRKENRDCAEAVAWGEKAIPLAEHFGDTDTLARTYNYMGCAMMFMDYERGQELMERSLAIAQGSNLPFAIGGTLANWGQILVELYRFRDAERYLTEGIPYATDHDDDYHLYEMLTWQAMARLYSGHWQEANETLLKVLQRPNLDVIALNYALVTLGRLRVRRGDSGARDVLDQALTLSVQADAVVRLGYARAARAEMAWLTGNNDLAKEEARLVYELAVSKALPWVAGELAFWRWRVGDRFTPPEWIAIPFANQIAGDWRLAAKEWEQRDCPYEQALALLDGDEAAQWAALEIFERLEAQPAVEKLKQNMRAQGIRSVPRGPRPAARANPFGLTGREMEILGYLVDGTSNQAIAQKLSLSIRTVEHHNASILQKMQVPTRNQAVALAVKNHLFPPQ